MKLPAVGGTATRWYLVRVATLMATMLFSSVVGVALYEGNLWVFIAFSLIFFAIVMVAISYPDDYAHLFLAIMWFIGFWCKFVLHRLTDWPYVEPVGGFQETPTNWDAVLIVCALGGGGYLSGRLAALPVSARLKSRWQIEQVTRPVWYEAWRGVFWAAAVMAIIAAVGINWRFGLLVRGSVAHTSLPWPLGGLFAWVTDIGLALAISILAAWDRQSGWGAIRGFVCLCIEGALLSLSTSSRALYLFHTLPFFLSERSWWKWNQRKLASLAIVSAWLALGAAVPSATTFGRLFGSSALPIGQEQLDQGVAPQRDVEKGVLINQGTTLLRNLVVERWVGLEGVMSTQSYSDKSTKLLWQAAFDRRSYGTVDVYTRDISKSGFTELHAQRFHYASPAGPIAFLYFSGSLWIVFAGMALIAILTTAIELLWTWLIRDPLPLAIGGWYLAFIVLQLSGGVQQAVAGPIMVTLLFATVWLVSNVRVRAERAMGSSTTKHRL